MLLNFTIFVRGLGIEPRYLQLRCLWAKGSCSTFECHFWSNSAQYQWTVVGSMPAPNNSIFVLRSLEINFPRLINNLVWFIEAQSQNWFFSFSPIHFFAKKPVGKFFSGSIKKWRADGCFWRALKKTNKRFKLWPKVIQTTMWQLEWRSVRQF